MVEAGSSVHSILMMIFSSLHPRPEADETSPYDPVGVLGVDIGIKNLEVDSD